MATVFISYSHVDKAIADELAEVLSGINIDYFRDVKDIVLGDSITSRVREEVQACVAILVIVSPGSLKSHWVPYEIGHASALGKVIVPFLTHPSLDPPHYIRDMNCATTVGQIRDYFTEQFPGEVQRNRQALVVKPTPQVRAMHGLTTPEQEVLRVLANAVGPLYEFEIAGKSNLAKKKVAFCMIAMREKGFVDENNQQKWEITHSGMGVTLRDLDDSAHAKALSSEVTNAEIDVLKVLANAVGPLYEFEIAGKSNLAKKKVAFCMIAMREKGFVDENNQQKWEITHSGTEFLLTNNLD